MSKFLKVLIALAAVTAMASTAMASDFSLKGYYQVRGITYDNLDLNDAAADNANGVDQRMRLWFNGAANENVKGVFAVEVDNVWGDTGATGKQVGKIGSDAKSQIEVKSAYLDVNLADYGVKLKAGTQGFNQAKGLIIADDAAGINVSKMINDMNLTFLWIKVAEGSKFVGSADSDYYSAQVSLKAGDFTIVPLLGYLHAANGDETTVYYGASADGKAGPVGLSLNLVLNNWDNSAANTDGAGYAATAKAVMDLGGVTTYAAVGYMGDKDNANGEFKDVSNYTNFAEVLTGGKFDNRGTVGAQAVSDTKMNWLYVKAGAKTKIGEKATLEGAIIYAQEAEDSSATVKALTYGTELDAYYTRSLADGLSLVVGGGYLFADDDAIVVGGTADDAYKLGTALTVKF